MCEIKHVCREFAAVLTTVCTLHDLYLCWIAHPLSPLVLRGSVRAYYPCVDCWLGGGTEDDPSRLRSLGQFSALLLSPSLLTCTIHLHSCSDSSAIFNTLARSSGKAGEGSDIFSKVCNSRSDPRCHSLTSSKGFGRPGERTFYLLSP